MNDRLPEIYKPGALRVVTPCDGSAIGIGIDVDSGETIRLRIPVSDALKIGQIALSHASGSSGIPNSDVSRSFPVDL